MASAYDPVQIFVIDGTLTRQHYIDQVLRTHVQLFTRHHPGVTLKDDNARPHSAAVSSAELCQSPGMACSTDMSLIEHACNILGSALDKECHSQGHYQH